MVVICFVIALPLSLWIVNRWMASFAYRAPFTVWIPVAALAAVLPRYGCHGDLLLVAYGQREPRRIGQVPNRRKYKPRNRKNLTKLKKYLLWLC